MIDKGPRILKLPREAPPACRTPLAGSATEPEGAPDTDVQEEVAEGSPDLHHVLPAERARAAPRLGRVDADRHLHEALPGAQELDQDLRLVGEAGRLDREALEIGGAGDDGAVVVAGGEAEEPGQEPPVHPRH